MLKQGLGWLEVVLIGLEEVDWVGVVGCLWIIECAVTVAHSLTGG